MYALRLASSVDPGDRNPPHRTAQVFYFGIGAAATRHGLWDQTGGYACDVFVDITDVAEKKLAALDALVSQGYGGAYARKRIETSDGAFGLAGNCAYGEGFISRHPTTHYYLRSPITPCATPARPTTRRWRPIRSSCRSEQLRVSGRYVIP